MELLFICTKFAQFPLSKRKKTFWVICHKFIGLNELNKGKINVVMTATSADGPEMQRHHTTKGERKTLSDRMKGESDELKIVIVHDTWLTGFDAPWLHTLYIDKPMRGHNLTQAIARVNATKRIYRANIKGCGSRLSQ